MDEIALLTGLLERYSPTLAEGEAVSYLVEAMQAAGTVVTAQDLPTTPPVPLEALG